MVSELAACVQGVETASSVRSADGGAYPDHDAQSDHTRLAHARVTLSTAQGLNGQRLRGVDPERSRRAQQDPPQGVQRTVYACAVI